jgi:hypothetical protein
MKNREIIANINGIIDFRSREAKRDKKTITGHPLLIMSRNFRTLVKEYEENYSKDLQELNAKYYDKKEVDVTVPADKEKGIEEHTERRTVDVLKPWMKEEDHKKELNELLDLDVTVPVMKVNIALLESVTDAQDADALEFMTDYGAVAVDC